MELRFLLLLLLLCTPGVQAQEYDAVESRVEEQNLTVECRYNAASYREQRKAWCQLRDAICSPLILTPLMSPRRDLKTATSGRTTIEDDTRNGIVTITMQNLQVEDAGVYRCGLDDPRNTFYPLKTIKLDVSKAVQEYSAMEGKTLSLACPYNSPDDKKARKAWCRQKVPNRCDVLVNTDYGFFGYQNRAQNGRATIEDDTQKGVVTITMKKLQEDDSGLYWCARYDPPSPSLYRIVGVKLTVTKAVQEYSATEGQTLSLACPYNSPDYKGAKKAWCRWTVPNKCDVLVNTDYRYGYENRAQNGRATIEDDTQKRVVTITMEKLQEDDSGLYWCARYDPPYTSLYHIVGIKLTVTKAPGTSEVPATTSPAVLSTARAGLTPADGSQKQTDRTFIILGVVLGLLLIPALIGVVILCTRKSRQRKSREGGGQAEDTYEEPRNIIGSEGFSNMTDPKDDKQEMPSDLKYATLDFKPRPSPKESVYANIMPSQALETPQPWSPGSEPVEYASISLQPLGAKQ